MRQTIVSAGEKFKNSLIESGVWDHIIEARNRIFKALLSLIIAVLLSFVMAEKLIQILAIPAGGVSRLQAIEVTETLSVFMRVAILGGLIISLPFVLYQILAFVIPGLTPQEQKWVYLAIPIATVLFVSGAMFTYFVLLPTALPFLLMFLGVETTPTLKNYIEFVTGMIFWVGVSFEAPLVVFVLAKLKIVSAKALLKQWRIAIVVIAILAAFITPTGDPVNMGLLMLPLSGIYLLSVLFAAVARRDKE